MKRWLTFFISAILLAATAAQAQDTTGQVVKWQYSAEKKSDGEFVLHFKGDIDEGWLLFSSSMSEDEPNTHIMLDTAAATATLVSVQEKEAPASRLEPLFDNLEIRYFEGTAELLATVKLQPGADKVTGIISYMALKGEEVAGPEEVPFRFNVDAAGNLVSAAAGLQ